MALHRREFLATAAVFLAAGSTVSVSVPASAKTAPAVGDRAELASPTAPQAPVRCTRDFAALWRWMDAHGWLAFLADAVGFTPELTDQSLFREINTPHYPQNGGLDDFGGRRLIHPGDPAMSLIYHALASPRVVRAGAPAEAYPSLAQLDALEDYIYGRGPDIPLGPERHVLAVFAYEYRPAARTPHQAHADFAFSRTGIARVGTKSAVYDVEGRCYRNSLPGVDLGQDVAVTPARYGLFLAELLTLEQADRFVRIGRERRDHSRSFLLPLRKVFSGDRLLGGGDVFFEEAHRNEKLRRLAKFEGKSAIESVELPSQAKFDLDRPPFLRESRSFTRPGSAAAGDEEMVSLTQTGSSALLTPVPGELVRPAWQAEERLRFKVPGFSKRVLGLVKNRRYTTLKLLEAGREEVIDFLISDFVARGGAATTGLRSPRNAPVFVNIRHEVTEEGTELGHLDADIPAVAEKIKKGGYWAAMFEDGLCDGCVQAAIVTGSNPAPPWGPIAQVPILPAFSLVAAPDLFPFVDPRDYDRKGHRKSFFEGGPEAASGGRLRGNPHVPLPGAAYPAFPRNARGLEERVANTITALVSHPAADLRGRPITTASDYRRLNTLSDAASNVFAPGWDLTFSREDDEPTYVATFGLGSPFPEDMKLCAAANGMWPGSSPDAARTFYGALKPVGTVRPPTAVPLLDTELGYHPDAPGGRPRASAPGWDGEHGPFLEQRDGALAVNFANIYSSDYVRNALGGKMDFSALLGLTLGELIRRMDAHRHCISALPGIDHVAFTSKWLVGAEAVDNWTLGARGTMFPKSSFADGAAWAVAARPGIAGPGFLYLFADCAGKPSPPEAGRSVQQGKRFYLCQVTADALAWTSFSPAVPVVEPRRWRFRTV